MKEKLQILLKNSYAPYSNMHFACIVETKDGNFYEGVNVENASYGGSICAERNAINNAVSHGEREFNALYLMSDSEEFLYPCHICKQTFVEFFDKDTIFNIMNIKGEMKVFDFKGMMNTTFDKDDVL
jgi:cytidine deaminase